MMAHYLYSMASFGSLIFDALRLAGVRDIVEIGAEFGEMSTRLAGIAEAGGGTLTSIDPCPRPEFYDWLAAHSAVRHVAEPSIDALQQIDAAADAWIVDGDHNWYTVYHELRLIRLACRRAGKPLLVFLHDVAWPCGRRDFYYAPETIPAEYRHDHDYSAGASLDWDGLVPNRGLRGHGRMALARHEGGPRNGVLTAVEDFIADAKQQGDALCYAHVPAALGLGVLFDAAAPWAEAIAMHMLPWHENELLKTLEKNRLRNYLAALEWQDRAVA
ncbi:class I SAM-dependent methyltransferase [Sphingomonas sp. DT-204]|uniref:class I SAM-dependent methyltransferase n=1 Tax=Sphingomonas sp. DT-204 TaxID=3396166 RepID=UPI003F1B09DB